MLMLVVLVGMALAALMVPLVITQTHTTTFDSGRGRALQAAESGIDLALGQIRASQSGTGDDGDASKLPCGPLQGAAGQANGSSYAVEIAYYTSNPVGKSDDWLATNAMTCVPDYGVSDPTRGVYIPSFVLLTSTGTDGQTGDTRTLTTTYVVHTTDISIPGGQIRLYPSGSSSVNYCLTVSPIPVDSSSTVTLQPCQDPVPDSQKFAYADQLGIELVASEGSNPQCIKAFGSSGNLGIGPCGVDTEAPWIEMWGFDNDSHFRVSDPNQQSLSNNCFGTTSTPTPTPPYTGVALQPCNGNGWQDPTQAWIPSPYVGAGGAGAGNGQLVNFYQFGRCLDVTDHNVTSDFLIAYGCMQIPAKDGNDVGSQAPWDQMFIPSPSISEDPADATPPTKAQYVVTCPSGGDGACAANTTYCLVSPAADGDFATVARCSAQDPNQVWTRYQKLDAAGNELAYADKYTIKDDQGRCLSLGSEQQMYHDYYFKVVVQECDGGTKQKWNARETQQDARMANLHEK
jgi:hypothetical protein